MTAPAMTQRDIDQRLDEIEEWLEQQRAANTAPDQPSDSWLALNVRMLLMCVEVTQKNLRVLHRALESCAKAVAERGGRG